MAKKTTQTFDATNGAPEFARGGERQTSLAVSERSVASPAPEKVDVDEFMDELLQTDKTALDYLAR